MPRGLVRDGGTLQIGIGQVGDALAQGLIVRHRNNDAFRELVKRLAQRRGAACGEESGTFEDGLYGVSEMFFEAFLALIDAEIINREVDGALLHGGLLSRTEGVLSRACARCRRSSCSASR